MKAELAAVISVVGCLSAAVAGAEEPAPTDALAGLVKAHPRLVLTDARLAELKKLAESDKLLAKAVGDVIKQADAVMGRPMLERKLVGPRLLSVSRECVGRIYALGLAWRWTGRQAYADKAGENLLAVCAFADWNPSHFLDTAEMSHAVGVGYDWFYITLDEPTRKTIRQGLIKLGLEPGLTCYRKQAGWVKNAFNWNQVCNAGLAVGALAIADTDTAIAQEILRNAVASLPKALATYAPDGAWAEGPGYWGYATRYTVYGLAAMETALGHDFGLSKIPGLSQAGHFPIYTAGPTGLYFNFADVGGNSRRGNLPSLFWLARRYDSPLLAEAERRVIAGRSAEPTDVIWYIPPGAKVPPADLVASAASAACGRKFGGSVEVAVFRSAWDDPNALFAAIKAGYNQVNHGHLDLGAFEMDALGVRWARELGSDDYNMPGYWQGSTNDGQRWTYYRLNSLSHNIPLLDDRSQQARAISKMMAFKAEGRGSFAVIDLTQAYTPLAGKAVRGLRVLDGRSALIQDELDLAKPCEALWGITTEAKIEPAGATATLTLSGKTLTVRLLSPSGASFVEESAARPAPENPNKGFRRLATRVKAPAGPLRFAVLLEPSWPDGKKADPPRLTPLAEWK